MGFQVHAIGLFLYLPSPQDLVLRSFYPATALRDKQIGKKLGAMLVENHHLTPEQVSGALDWQQSQRTEKLGEYLTANKIVTQDALVAALEAQRHRPMLRLGEALLQQGTITQAQLEDALEIGRAHV